MTPYWQSEGVTLYQGDCRAVLAELPTESVQTCVSSPPYFGLRAYNGGNLEIGAEGDLDAYIANLVDVFRGVWRVLRDDGCAWINLGDSYAAGKCGRDDEGPADLERRAVLYHTGKPKASAKGANGVPRKPPPGLKPKDLIGVPWRAAFALQADGWYLRSAVVWHKPNAMPESVRDRPTMDYEMVFLLSKRDRYYFDQDSIREPAQFHETRGHWASSHNVSASRKTRVNGAGRHDNPGSTQGFAPNPAGRNKRSVWQVATQPLRAIDGIDHFAAFPERLVEPMIKAGSSERGACPECQAPWGRETRRTLINTDGWGQASKDHHDGINGANATIRNGAGRAGDCISQTLGFRPSCPCPPADPIPCVILDPFVGSGRAGVVARKLGRHFIGIDLNQSYLDLSRSQISAVQPPLIGASA